VSRGSLTRAACCRLHRSIPSAARVGCAKPDAGRHAHRHALLLATALPPPAAIPVIFRMHESIDEARPSAPLTAPPACLPACLWCDGALGWLQGERRTVAIRRAQGIKEGSGAQGPFALEGCVEVCVCVREREVEVPLGIVVFASRVC
jgi:hypothetical protein